MIEWKEKGEKEKSGKLGKGKSGKLKQKAKAKVERRQLAQFDFLTCFRILYDFPKLLYLAQFSFSKCWVT